DRPVRAWTALRVVAGAGGARRGAGLEAPFVGRDRELQTVIDVFEASASNRHARLVTVVGDAGTGKSRLLWEFFKYMDGVERLVSWHQGRCLSYGDGVAYWALAEMVRARAWISEEEGAESSRSKLSEAVARWVPDEREGRLVEPRLAHLLGLEQRTASDRADLFSGWRLFFERMSEQAPVVLVFEDLQWADSGLLEFIDYLLDWSAERPLFVLALGRPELLETRPAWTQEAIALGLLPDAAMRELFEGLAPGLPEELAARVLARAEGIPLYAVETVRMLLDRGLLTQEGNRYQVTGDVGELDVPETLHALAAARLDGLTAAERAILQDGAVFGQSFTPAGVAALGERPPERVVAILDGLVDKQVLGFNDDRLSSERGQYHFLQALLRTTAYGTLSRRDRKNRHLAAARYLQEAWGEAAPELAEILAAHFLDAAAADPEAADAPRIRAAACQTLADAGERALSLALGAEARHAFDRAAELADDDPQRAGLLHRAGQAARLNGEYDAAHERLAAAVELFETLGDSAAAARSSVVIGQTLYAQDRLTEAIEVVSQAVAALPEGRPETAAALAALAQLLGQAGDFDGALQASDQALTIGEPLREWETVVRALQALSYVRGRHGRVEESMALSERALKLALEHDLTVEALRTYNNLGDNHLQDERYAEAREWAETGVALAKARGDRFFEELLNVMVVTAAVGQGDWDAAAAFRANSAGGELLALASLPARARIQAGRGDLEVLAETLREAEGVETANREFGRAPVVAQAIALNAFGRPAEALEAALPVAVSGVETANEDRREAYIEAGHAALALGDEATVERLVTFVAELPPSMRSPLLRASAARFAGLLAQRRGDLRTAEEAMITAERHLREIGAAFFLAQVLVEQAELLRCADRDDEAAPLLAEATTTFERLGAAPWLQRARTDAAEIAA
ncbi:MAG: ATP-binding protein, partial [Solirubrobacteraceae bacterium]